MTATAKLLFLATAVLSVAGCHTFQPSSYDAVTPGQTVRARIAGAWTDSLETLLLRDSRTLEGTVVERPEGEILMEVTVQNELRGIQFETLKQRISLPREAVVDLELKNFDRGRTIGVTALAVIAVGSFVIQQLSKDTGGSGRPGTGGPVESRIPALFRIPLP